MKTKSLSFLFVLLLSTFGCSKNEPTDNIQRMPASTEQTTEPIDKSGNIYLTPANNPSDRCQELYGTTSC